MWKFITGLFAVSVDSIIADFECKVVALNELSEAQAENAISLQQEADEAQQESSRAEAIADKLSALIA